MAPVSAAAMERSGNYRSCYDNIVKFQILDEIESLFDLRVDCGGEGLGKRLQDLFAEWSARMSYSQASLSNHEQVLKVRRTLLEIYIERINRSGTLMWFIWVKYFFMHDVYLSKQVQNTLELD